MKKLLFLVAILFVSGHLASAQFNEKTLKASMADYLEKTEQKDFEGLADYLHPSIFDVVSRDEMIDIMKQTFDSEEMSMSISNTEVNEVSDIIQDEGISYAYVIGAMDLYMTMEEMDEDFATFMISIMDQQHGEGSSSYDEEKNSLKIKITTYTFAVGHEDGWKFVRDEEDAFGMLDRAVPEEVRNSLRSEESTIE